MQCDSAADDKAVNGHVVLTVEMVDKSATVAVDSSASFLPNIDNLADLLQATISDISCNLTSLTHLYDCTASLVWPVLSFTSCCST